MAFIRNIEDLECWANKIFECYIIELNRPLWGKFLSTDCGGLTHKASEGKKALSRTGLETICVSLCQESSFILPVI